MTGVTDFQLEQLKRLPQQADEVWQGGLVRLHSWITGETPQPYRPWAALWVAVHADQIGPPITLRPEEVNFTRAVDGIIALATDPQIGGYRPGQVEVRDPARRDIGADPELVKADTLIRRKETVGR